MIDFRKAGTLAVVGGLMAWYDDTSTAAWIYLALHGGHGLVWLLKDPAFPDSGWQRRVTLLGGLDAFVFVLGPYGLIGRVLVSGLSQPVYPFPEGAWYALCIGLCMSGSALTIAADAQKTFALRLRPGLVTDGVYRCVRHPNGLGERMIHGSFALLAWHGIPVLVLAWVWLAVFAVNMVMKEASLARDPGWAEYRRRTWWLLPFVW